MTANTSTLATPEKAKRWCAGFLEAFAHTGTVKGACAVAGIDRSTAYRERHRNETFALAWHAVEEDATDELELEAYRRAINGSDLLLIFLLKARKSDMYRDNVRVEQDIKISATGAALVTDSALAKEGRGLLRRAAGAGGDVAGGPGGGDQ